jgi:ATP-dependent DNA helicase RecG
MGIVTARDLLFHLPRRYDDASTIVPIARLEVGMDASALGRVRSKGVLPTRKGLRIFQAVLQDESGMITVSWPGQPWLDRKIREGDRLLVTGPVRFFHGRQLQPREFTIVARSSSDAGASDEPRALQAGTIFVSYPASEEVPQWVFRRIFEANLTGLLQLVETEEHLTPAERRDLGLPGLRDALTWLHRPEEMGQVESGRRRLAYDELFFLQVVQARARHRETVERPGIRFERSNDLIRPMHERLPFELTEAQARVLREIYHDMTSPRRMNRLLQGDVGSGKTVVALFAMLLAVESGYQAALMAPTEILAEQHASGLKELLDGMGVDSLESGRASIAVGTHALIQDAVAFQRLGLVVVDEQHRFGVRQRMALGERDPRPDVLMMSATPIPRSLAMTFYGDLDLSVLDQLPPGRKPVRTRLERPRDRKSIHDFVAKELAAGRQAYVVYPLVGESEKIDLKAATEEYERLRNEVFGDYRLGLLHGQLPGDEKDRVMRAFRDGGIDLVVATSVVEVGIDVPNATVMVIEHAERFGLAQLHQLRGRVGRGAEESHCILIAQAGDEAFQRLRTFRDTQDGFAIAEADLRIRGQGDLFGSQQHGRGVMLRFADLVRDEDLLVEAQRRARATVEADPELRQAGNRQIADVLRARYAERLRLYRVG